MTAGGGGGPGRLWDRFSAPTAPGHFKAGVWWELSGILCAVCPVVAYGSYMDRFLYTSVVVPTLPCAEVPTVSGPPEAGAAQKCSCTHPGAVSELSPWGSLPSMSRGLALGPDVRSQRKAESCSHGNAGSGFQKR